ncbi:MAG: DUF4434 domain-containing protein [Spirochaetota bacterium]
MMIRGTFLDEISHDIPHQNWGPAEWDADFAHMRAIGIDTVVLIRCGYRRWLTYPSAVAMSEEGAFEPPLDLVRLFLDLSAKHHMAFHFGLYDSGTYWTSGDYEAEVELNRRVIAEAWSRYGGHPAFAGWYLSQECSRRIGRIAEMYARLGRACKDVSGGLPVLISPYIDGPKPVLDGIGVGVDTGRLRFTNIGGSQRIQFDVIGGAINGASRLQSLTKQMGRPLIISAEVADEQTVFAVAENAGAGATDGSALEFIGEVMVRGQGRRRLFGSTAQSVEGGTA